jgi:ribose transport system permease protein
VLSVLRYNAMFALVSLGMAYVIMTGGIDLSVGSVAALGSVVSALLSPYGLLPGLLGGVAAGLLVGAVNALVITRLAILPFIATLATMLAASGCALLLAGNQSVSVSYEGGFIELGQGDFLGFPIPAWIAAGAFVVGSGALNLTAWGRTVLAIGGNEDATRMMGLPADRVKASVYILSGGLAGLAGVILAAQFGAGQPIEGVGWELFAIASVVVGGTLLTGGVGSVGATLAGVLLLGLIFNILNFENGLGWISLSGLLAIGDPRRLPAPRGGDPGPSGRPQRGADLNGSGDPGPTRGTQRRARLTLPHPGTASRGPGFSWTGPQSRPFQPVRAIQERARVRPRHPPDPHDQAGRRAAPVRQSHHGHAEGRHQFRAHGRQGRGLRSRAVAARHRRRGGGPPAERLPDRARPPERNLPALARRPQGGRRPLEARRLPGRLRGLHRGGRGDPDRRPGGRVELGRDRFGLKRSCLPRCRCSA